MSSTYPLPAVADPTVGLDYQVYGRTDDDARLKEIAQVLRADIVRMLAAAPSGHTAGPLGMAELLTTLYFNAMPWHSLRGRLDGIP